MEPLDDACKLPLTKKNIPILRICVSSYVRYCHVRRIKDTQDCNKWMLQDNWKLPSSLQEPEMVGYSLLFHFSQNLLNCFWDRSSLYWWFIKAEEVLTRYLSYRFEAWNLPQFSAFQVNCFYFFSRYIAKTNKTHFRSCRFHGFDGKGLPRMSSILLQDKESGRSWIPVSLLQNRKSSTFSINREVLFKDWMRSRGN